jgi:hypothetical protein
MQYIVFQSILKFYWYICILEPLTKLLEEPFHLKNERACKELLTLPEHLSSPPDFSVARVARSFVFCVVFCRSLLGLWSFFLLTIVLSVHLQFSASYYSFGIFKIFWVSSSCSVIVCFVHTRDLLTVLFTPGFIVKICFLSLDFKLDAIHSISEDSQILLVHMHSRTSYKIIGRTFPLKKRTCLYFLCFVLTIYRTDNKQ